MSNKKLHLVFGLVLAVLVGLVGSFASAVSFTLDFGGGYNKPETWGAVRQNMVPIHFADNGNDFHGFIYFSDGIVDVSESTGHIYYVKFGTGMMECQKKVKGFYYNAERGERLWPLDGTYGSITAKDGIYTRCRQKGYSDELKNRCGGKGEKDREDCEKDVEKDFVDSFGYYGMVTHDVGNQKFALVVGTDYEVKDGDEWITMGNQLAPTFVRIDNKYPVGFIYDVNGGAGFVGCEVKEGGSAQIVLDEYKQEQSVNGRVTKENWHDLFGRGGNNIVAYEELKLDCSNEGSAMNSLIKVVVDGLVGINKDTKNTGIQGNQSNAKMQYFSSVSVNNMQLINYARQKAEILCRGKWNNYTSSDKIRCISRASDDPIIAETNKTYIVKGGADVKIKDMNDFVGTDYYDIFIDNGNLLIEPTEGTELTVFKKNGFKSDNNLAEFNTAVSNALSAGHDYSGDDVAAGRFIRGNFIVNGSIKGYGGESLDNVYFIYGKMTSKDTVDQLEKVFEWKCNAGSGSDGMTPCPGGWKDADGNTWNNPYQNASLVIIDQNYSSPLYK